MTRDESKERYQKYHRIAQEATKGTNIKVAEFANVQVIEDGAFVEASIWVPKLELGRVKI